MPRRKQQRKKINKFEFARRQEHLVLAYGDYFRNAEVSRFRRFSRECEGYQKEMKGGRNGLLQAITSPP